MNMLSEMPIDVLKLDMKFIQTEIKRPASQGILPFIVSLARWMKLSVVAEGVETQEQLERLQNDGCDYAQGYYFAKPMPAGEFEKILTASQSAGTMEDGQAAAPASHGERLLLVADGDADYRAQVCRTFSGCFEVREAASCEEALHVLGNKWSETAAVILSLSLPGLDGMRILDAIQKARGGWEIQVIATGPSDMELERLAIAQGAADYAVKPHSQEVLRRRVLRAVNIHSLQERARVLQDEACRDTMTGLLNRRGLNAIADTLRQEADAAVYMFDLDNLKKFNDKYGHEEGDHLIIHFASLLRAHTRAEDVLVRLGGDEFLVVIRRVRTLDEAGKKGMAICRAFYKSRYADLDMAACSAGVTLWHGKESVHEIIRQADEAMYAAKTSGKGGCVPWSM